MELIKRSQALLLTLPEKDRVNQGDTFLNRATHNIFDSSPRPTFAGRIEHGLTWRGKVSDKDRNPMPVLNQFITSIGPACARRSSKLPVHAELVLSLEVVSQGLQRISKHRVTRSPGYAKPLQDLLALRSFIQNTKGPAVKT